MSTKACLPCRRLHSRCDGAQPCRSCTQRGTEDECIRSTPQLQAYLTSSAKACTPCQRRKTACDRNLPCDTCSLGGEQGLCFYSRDTDFKTTKDSEQQALRDSVKQQAKLACTNCRIRKSKCDRLLPCTSCRFSRLSNPCTYDHRDKEKTFQDTSSLDEGLLCSQSLQSSDIQPIFAPMDCDIRAKFSSDQVERITCAEDSAVLPEANINAKGSPSPTRWIMSDQDRTDMTFPSLDSTFLADWLEVKDLNAGSERSRLATLINNILTSDSAEETTSDNKRTIEFLLRACMSLSGTENVWFVAAADQAFYAPLLDSMKYGKDRDELQVAYVFALLASCAASLPSGHELRRHDIGNVILRKAHGRTFQKLSLSIVTKQRRQESLPQPKLECLIFTTLADFHLAQSDDVVSALEMIEQANFSLSMNPAVFSDNSLKSTRFMVHLEFLTHWTSLLNKKCISTHATSLDRIDSLRVQVLGIEIDDEDREWMLFRLHYCKMLSTANDFLKRREQDRTQEAAVKLLGIVSESHNKLCSQQSISYNGAGQRKVDVDCASSMRHHISAQIYRDSLSLLTLLICRGVHSPMTSSDWTDIEILGMSCCRQMLLDLPFHLTLMSSEWEYPDFAIMAVPAMEVTMHYFSTTLFRDGVSRITPLNRSGTNIPGVAKWFIQNFRGIFAALNKSGTAGSYALTVASQILNIPVTRSPTLHSDGCYNTLQKNRIALFIHKKRYTTFEDDTEQISEL